MFYTYIHYTADENKPFYIGKGKGRRFSKTGDRNRWWKAVVAKHGFIPKILAKWSSEHEAFEHEKFLISCFKNLGFKLVNLSEGGEGAAGVVMSQETKDKIRQANKGKVFSEERKQNISKSITGRKLSVSHKEKVTNILKTLTDAQKIKVKCITSGISYASVSEAALKTGLDASSIVRCCKNKQKTVGNTEWKYDIS